MRVQIETDRLILRNVTPDDYQACFAWCGDPDVNEYMIYPLYKKAEDVKTWLESKDEDDPDDYDLGFVLKETGELIGMGGLFYKEEEDIWKIGYNLRKDMWGNGYVPEAMRAIIDHVRSVRDVRVIEGEVCVDNNKSRRVMEKLGMSYYGDCRYTKLDGSRTYEAGSYRIVYGT